MVSKAWIENILEIASKSGSLFLNGSLATHFESQNNDFVCVGSHQLGRRGDQSGLVFQPFGLQALELESVGALARLQSERRTATHLGDPEPHVRILFREVGTETRLHGALLVRASHKEHVPTCKVRTEVITSKYVISKFV